MGKRIHDWLEDTTSALKQAGIETARLDSLVLLCDEIGHDKSWILAHPERELQESELEILNKNIAQRLQHIPLAYIRGKVEFFGREFMVDEQVLVPRPESEAIIELLKRVAGRGLRVAIFDIGTGSGVLAITAKLEIPKANVVASDIDESCIQVARKNAHNHEADISFLSGDLLHPLLDAAFKIQDSIFVANLPYVPESYPINYAAAHEPKLALFSGKDGLNHYSEMFTQLKNSQAKPLYIITEALQTQHEALRTIAQNTGYRQLHQNGLAQCFSLTK